ncbi:MAG: OmpA family protein, partial [Hyphomicrobium sp.]
PPIGDRTDTRRRDGSGRDGASRDGGRSETGRPDIRNPDFRRSDADRRERRDGPRGLDAVKDSRSESTEAGGRRTIIRESDNRVIVRENNRVFIQSNRNRRFERFSRDARTRSLGDGTRLSVVNRPGGITIHSVTDRDGRLVRRFRRDRDGREITILDNRRRDRFGRPIAIGLGLGIGALIARSIIDVPPPRIRMPREKYIVEYDRASDEDLYEALSAPPLDRLERAYTLDEVLVSRGLRDRMRRIDHSSINFAFGAWEVDEAQVGKLERIARAMLRVIDRNPAEMFLVEGHTDAVGSDVDNLTLSDRRAEAVAEILTEEFGVPPENLATQGYGEQFLKVETDEPERLNRRVAFLRLTPLLAQRDDRDERSDRYPRDDRDQPEPRDDRDDRDPRDDQDTREQRDDRDNR